MHLEKTNVTNKTMVSKIQVVIVDDHEIVRAALAELLNKSKDISVVAEASTGEETLKIVRETQPDVILLDITMPGIGGLETVHRLKHFAPNIKVIILTTHDNPPYPDQFLNKARVDGYLLKNCDTEELCTAIRTVYKGKRHITSKIAQDLALKNLGVNQASPFDALSDRELEILYMIIHRNPIADIAKSLYVSTKTVNSHRYRIFKKLGVNSDVEVVKLAFEYGLLERFK